MVTTSRSQLLLPILLLLILGIPLVVEGRGAYVRPANCEGKCKYRCSETSHKKPCMFFCIKCCSSCHCVPPGTYGNKQSCPCYNNWKTKEGRPKCP